jgi:2-hydroxy-3-keto-5-methylthiopentenyl-1-phosphate phosphatase
VRRAQAAGFRVALVGNGSSDLCGARLADLVLARDILLEHCKREGIACAAWESFEDVRAVLEGALRGGAQP